VQNRYLRFRLLVLLAGTAAAVLLAPSAGAKQTANWASRRSTRSSLTADARSVNSFQPNAPLTKPELTELLAALPTDAVVDPGSTPATRRPPARLLRAPPTFTRHVNHNDDHNRYRSDARPDYNGSTTTTTTKKSGSPPGSVKPGASVSVSAFDAALVKQLGLDGAAASFRSVIRQAGASAPARYGTETVARLLGLRINHPASQDKLELLPTSPITRAEAAYSIAQLLKFTGEETQWVEDTSNALELPVYNSWQKRILSYAVSFIGYPTSGAERAPTRRPSSARQSPVASTARDSSGGVQASHLLRWQAAQLDDPRTYHLRDVGEVGRAKRIAIDALEPGDVLFFGTRARARSPARSITPRSTSAAAG